MVQLGAMKLSKILVPTDFSGCREPGLRTGTRARARRERRAPRAASPPVPDPALSLASAAGRGELQRSRTPARRVHGPGPRRSADAARAPRRGRASGVRVQSVIEERFEPYEAILQKASEWGPDLILMGTHGRQGLDKILDGKRRRAGAPPGGAERHARVARTRRSTESATRQAPSSFPWTSVRTLSGRSGSRAFSRSERAGPRCISFMSSSSCTRPSPRRALEPHSRPTPELKDKYREALTQMLGDTPGRRQGRQGHGRGGDSLVAREARRSRLIVMGAAGIRRSNDFCSGSVSEKPRGSPRFPSSS